ncbi:putative DNA-binding domain-containing protein [Luteibacter sp. 329MFSha]|uniref:HvfC/BufC family peptide modification chaperone n=1 Tax=Luteibacter sp. 329MFSha TaxID=1798239 RepID=UPI0008C68E66|nr:putative DNA-binding domain-containing protein [Luteibacter sp. 329MFSha]SEW21355.1 Putative DNA-binding domain-containing protein [Luteibacter sp. 329MFSha]
MPRPAASLSRFQRSFQAALVGEAPAAPWDGVRGFAVHYGTTRQAAIDALEANYPAVACLVGAEWFRSAAAAYAVACPPGDPRSSTYGDAFPAFLAAAPAARHLPYLADVARLDRFFLESQFAADARSLDVAALRALDACALGELAVAPHPATRILAAATPAFAIWEASRQGRAVGDDLAWTPQVTLITRPLHEVEVTTTEGAALDFLDACRGGATLARCIDRVASLHPAVPADRVFSHLLQARALTTA